MGRQIGHRQEVTPFFQQFFANFDQNAANSPYGAIHLGQDATNDFSSLPTYKGPVLILQGGR